MIRRAEPTTRPATAAGAVALAALVLVLLPPPASPAWAQTGSIPGGRHVLVVLLDRASPSVIAPSASLQGIAARGAAGLMATATAHARGGDAPLAPVVTLSAGAPAVGPVGGGGVRSFQAGPPGAPTRFGTVGQVYRTRTGLEPSGAWVYPDVALVDRLNADPTVGVTPGLLGQTLRRAGIPTAAIGDADLPGSPLRPAPILAMDERGQVPFGGLGTDRAQAGGVLPVTVVEPVMEARVKQALGQARFVVVDWGDVSRVDRLQQANRGRLGRRDQFGATLLDRLDAARSASIDSLDTFLSFTLRTLRLGRDVIVVVSPSPSADDVARGLDLGPIVVAGGGVAHGTLTSDTTGRDGLVSNVDLAPSVLRWFGLPIPPQMVGHPFLVHTAPFPLSSALADFRHFSRAARQRDAVLAAALLLWLLAFGLGVLTVESRLRALARSLAASATDARRRDRRRGPRLPPGEPRGLLAARTLLFAAALLPLALLLEPVVATGQTGVTILVVLLLALALGLLWAASGRRRTATGLGVVGGFTLAALLLNLVAGSHFSSRSVAGPAVWSGRDFSDLGTILAGAAVAGSILVAGALARKLRRAARPRRSVQALVAALVVPLSLPAAGGVVAVGAAGLPGMATLTTLVEERRPSRRAWWLAGIGAGAALVVAAGLLLASAVGRARTGVAAGAPRSAGPAALAAILVHRSGDALRLLVASPWTPAIVASLAALIYAQLRLERGPWTSAPRGRGLPPADRFVRATLVGLEVAAVLALLTSTAGAAVCGTILMGAALLAMGSALDRAGPPSRA